MDRGLDPLDTNLVVADKERSNKTICLAVTPPLKELGIPGRPRLFEVEQTIAKLNAQRSRLTRGGGLLKKSISRGELINNKELLIDYIIATPRMSRYIEASTEIYNIYLDFISEEDIHVYSIDEVFIDLTPYLNTYDRSGEEIGSSIARKVFELTGITATVGVGTNLYLAKIAMDMVAKHMNPDRFGIRIAALDELKYRKLLWNHRPITDFWRVGKGYARRLASVGLNTMGDIAICSMGDKESYYNDSLIYRIFGINGELLIDHAWGYEPCSMSDIKNYEPESQSVCQSQVLHEAYEYNKVRIIVYEMAESLSLQLAEKGMLARHFHLRVGYDLKNLRKIIDNDDFNGELVSDSFGRVKPKHVSGRTKLTYYTNSTIPIRNVLLELFTRIVDKRLYIRRISIAAIDPITEAESANNELLKLIGRDNSYKERKNREVERVIMDIKKKFGKNSIVRGTSMQEGATGRERNNQIGGHKA